MNLTDRVCSKVDSHYYPVRIGAAVYTIGKNKGWVYGLGAGLAISGSATVIATLAGLCFAGVGLSLMEITKANDIYSKLTPLGNVGGWWTLPIASFLAAKTIIEAVVREGEYIKIKSICKKWVLKDVDIENPNPNMRREVYELLAAVNQKRIFRTSIAGLHVSVLNICKVTDPIKPALENVAKKIQESSCLTTASLGFQAMNQLNGISKSVSFLIGVVFPIMLIANTIFSVVGIVGLSHTVFINQTDVEETGHFPEWIINAIGGLSFAYVLYLWYISAPGNLALIKRIYEDELKALGDHQLRSIGNQELLYISGNVANNNYPGQFKIV